MKKKETNHKRAIEKVIETAATISRGRALRVTLPDRIYKEIETDLKLVLSAERRGQPPPSAPRLAKHIKDAYGVKVGKDSVLKWLARLREGAAKDDL